MTNPLFDQPITAMGGQQALMNPAPQQPTNDPQATLAGQLGAEQDLKPKEFRPHKIKKYNLFDAEGQAELDAMPVQERQNIATNYFDSEYANDPEYLAMSPEDQADVRSNFMDQSINPSAEELENYSSPMFGEEPNPYLANRRDLARVSKTYDDEITRRNEVSKAYTPYADKIAKAQEVFDSNEALRAANPEMRTNQANEYFNKHIRDDNFDDLSDDHQMAIYNDYMNKATGGFSPEEIDERVGSATTGRNTAGKMGAQVMHTLTNDPDWQFKALGNKWYGAQDKSTAGAIAKGTTEAAPYIASAIATAGIGAPTLAGAALSLGADVALTGAIATALYARDDRAASKIASEVGLAAGVNGVTWGILRALRKGGVEAASQSLYNMKWSELPPEKAAGLNNLKKQLDETPLTAEQQKNLDDLGKGLDEIDANMGKTNSQNVDEAFAKAAGEEPPVTTPKPDEPVATPKEPIKDDAFIEAMRQTREASAKFKASFPTMSKADKLKSMDDIITLKEAEVPHLPEHLQAGARKNIENLKSTRDKFTNNPDSFNPKSANVFYAQGGSTLGGGFAGGAQGLYEEIVEGKELTSAEYLARIGAGAAAGTALGKLAGGKPSKSTASMFGASEPAVLRKTKPVVAKKELPLAPPKKPVTSTDTLKPTYEVGAHTNLGDKKTRKWISDNDLSFISKSADVFKERQDKFQELHKTGLDYSDISDHPEYRALQEKYTEATTGKLPEFIDHPELFEREPYLKDINVIEDFPFRSHTTRGSYDPGTNTIKLAQDLTDEEKLSVIAHEVQHGIQEENDWGRGGNQSISKSVVDSMAYNIEKKYKKPLATYNAAKEEAINIKDMIDLKEWDFTPEKMDRAVKSSYPDLSVPERKNLIDSINTLSIEDLRAMKKESVAKMDKAFEDLKPYYAKVREFDPLRAKSDYDIYQQLAGEQEARATQAALKHPGMDPYKALELEEGKVPRGIVIRPDKHAEMSSEEPYFVGSTYKNNGKEVDGKRTFKRTIHMKDGSRLSGMTDPKTFYGYDKNGEQFTIKAKDVDKSQVINSNKASNQFLNEPKVRTEMMSEQKPVKTKTKLPPVAKPKKTVAHIPYEATPSDKVGGARRRFYDAIQNSQNGPLHKAFVAEVAAALTTKGGYSRVMNSLGIKVKDDKMLIGSFEGTSNPLRYLEVPVEENADGSLTQESKDLLNYAAAALGKMLHQDGVGWFVPKKVESIEEATGFYFPMGMKFTKAMADKIYEASGLSPVAHPSGKGFTLINFEESEDFSDRVKKVEILHPKVNAEALQHDGDYQGPWSYDQTIKDMHESISNGRDHKKLRESYNDTAAAVEEVYRKYAAKFGLDWDEQVPDAGGTIKGNQGSDLYKGEESLEWADPKITTNRQLAEALDHRAAQSESGVLAPTDFSKNASKVISDILTEEIATAIEKNPDTAGIGWYSHNFDEAVKELSTIYPQLKKPEERTIFTTLVAVTSDGQEVSKNLEMAIDAYDHYTKHGKIGATIAGGQSVENINNNLKLIDDLIEEHGADLGKWLNETSPISEIAEDMADRLDQPYKKILGKLGYPADFEGVNSFIFGPKLGAFYQNLAGGHGFLTMDRWWMRSINRARGQLTSTASHKGIAEFTELLKEAGEIPKRTDVLPAKDLAKFVQKYKKIYEKSGFKDKTEINKKANNIGKSMTGTNDSPRGPADRAFMVRTTEQVLKNLKDRGIDISVADAQAVEWYFEKTLFNQLGVPAKNDNVGYGDVIKKVIGDKADTNYMPETNKLDMNQLNANLLTPFKFVLEDIPFAAMDGVDWVAVKIQKMILKGKTADEALGDLLKNGSDNELFDQIKMSLVQDYRLTDKYLKMADAAQIEIKRGETAAHKMFEQLKDLSDDQLEQIHNYVGGEADSISPHLKPTADGMKRAIKNLSQQLVDLGLLPQDVMDAYRKGYVHRDYEKHLQKSIAEFFFDGQKKLQKQYKRGKLEKFDKKTYDSLLSTGQIGQNIRDSKYVYEGLKNGKYELRRDWTKAEREQMGEITNASYTIPNTIMRLQKDISYGKFIAEVKDQMPELVKTSDEMKALAGVSNVNDIPTSGHGFTHLKGQEYGKMNGLWVEDAVARDLNGFKKALYGKDNKVAEALSAGVTQWKLAKTIKNPAAHLNNFVANMVMGTYAGMKPSEVVTNWASAARSISREDALFKEAESIGLFGRSKLEDIRRVIDKPANITRGKFNRLARNIVLTEDSKVGNMMFRAYEWEDNVGRLGLYKFYRDKGLSPQKAMAEAGRVVFDYSKRMPSWISGMRDLALIPFISWTYKALPLMARTLAQKPSRLLALYGMYAIYENAMIGGSENKPEFMRGKYLTVAKNGDNVMQLRTASMTPYLDWISEPMESIKQLVVGGIPQKVLEGFTGVQMWNGRDISYRKGAEKALDYGMWGVNAFTPIPGAWQKAYNLGEAATVRPKKDKLMVPRTPLEAAAGMFGINLKSYKQSKANEIAAQKKRDEI